MNPPQQQQQQKQQLPLSTIERDDTDDDYLQVLDAGEHMYGMFVADDQDLYAYLSINEEASPSWMIDDIEDIISRSLCPSPLDSIVTIQQQAAAAGATSTTTANHQHKSCAAVEDCRASFSDLQFASERDSDNESAKTGRLTPTRNEIDDHDEMSQ